MLLRPSSLWEFYAVICFLRKTNTWFLGEFFFVNVRNTRGTSPLQSAPDQPSPPGWRSFISFYSFLPFFVLLHPVWFPSPSTFHVLILFSAPISFPPLPPPFLSSNGNQSYLKLFVSVPIRRCSLTKNSRKQRRGDKRVTGVVVRGRLSM